MALALYIALVAFPAARANVGFAVYYTAAHVLAREPWAMPRIYDNAWFAAQLNQVAMPGIYDIFFYNPPTMSLILLPLIGLGPAAVRLIWPLLGLPLLLGGLALLARALALPARWGMWAAPACLLYAPVTENIATGQVYLLLFFLLCAGFWALAAPADDSSPRMLAERRFLRSWRPLRLRPNHNLSAGLVLGLMLALKTAGAWLWPLLLVGRRWRALAWAAACAAGFALATLPWIGVVSWRMYLALLPELVRDPKRYVTAYQTVTSLFGHLLVYDARLSPAPIADLPGLARTLTLAVTLAALALSAWWARLDDERQVVRALSLALCTALIVTNTPFAEGYHYTLALPALLTATWWAWHARTSRRVWAALALAGLLIGAPLPYKSAGVQAGWLALLAYPRVYGAYLLWGWIAWAIARAKTLKHSNVRTFQRLTHDDAEEG
ncbi:MAG TPA: glycosyltransferase 87 family protein [Roseiflexaceae bacterium]